MVESLWWRAVMLGVVVGACVGGGERGLLRPFCVDECLGFRIWC